jgi:hypothetical protein
MERTGANGGGIMQVICGFLEFQPGETYEVLRDRVKHGFAETKGPGVFFAIPCDQEKKEIKNVDKARFEYKDSEVTMPEAPGVSEASPMGDALKNVRRMTTDMAALQKMELESQFMKKALGIKDEKKEEEPVKESPAASGMNDMFLWKTLMDDGGKKKDSNADSALQQQLNDLKMERLVTDRIEKAMNELKVLVQPKEDSKTDKLLEKFIEMQARPKEDSKVEKLLERFMEMQAQPKEDKVEKLLERLLTKDDEAKREEARRDERRREEERGAEERRRWEADLKQREEEKKEERRRHEEEIRRREDEKKDEERRRLEELKHRDTDRREEERRREDNARSEKTRLEEGARLEREKFEKELTEQKRRFDEEAKIRREEMKSDDVRNRQYSTEQQKFQLQLLDIFKNNKDSSLETTSKIVESLTAAGMSSMKTAQDAAETIMEVAKNATPHRNKEKDKEDGKGFMENFKDIASLAAPFFAPYADADAKIKVLQAASKMSGSALQGAGIPGMGGQQQQQQRRMPPRPPASNAPAPGGYSKSDIDSAVDAFTKATGIKPSKAEVEQAMAAFGMSGVSAPSATPAPAAAPMATAPSSVETPQASAAANSNGSTYGGMASMIAQYLKAYPILKQALIGNLQDKIGVRSFMPVVTGLNQPTLEGLLANVPHQVVMSEIRQVCNEAEAKLIDENEAWFSQFRKEMITVLKDSQDDEDEETEAEAEAKVQIPEVAKK